MTDKSLFIVLRIISFIGLLVYPIVMLANVMSLGGYRSEDTPFTTIISAYSFIIFSSLYPLPFIYSLKKRKEQNVNIAVLPLAHLVISIILLIIWLAIG